MLFLRAVGRMLHLQINELEACSPADGLCDSCGRKTSLTARINCLLCLRFLHSHTTRYTDTCTGGVRSHSRHETTWTEHIRGDRPRQIERANNKQWFKNQ